MMILRKVALCFTVAAALFTGSASAWGPNGHETIGGIADQLLAGTRAGAEVKRILGGLTLREASVWADCAKGVDPTRDYAYTTEGRFRECAIFETADGEAELSGFVRRNDTNCDLKPGEESCHKQYHYTDVAIEHDRYDPSYVGTSDHDVVHAVKAAILVLKGQPAPAPFNIRGKRDALLLLVHHVGDLHQPLHVGAVYLTSAGMPVNPDTAAFSPSTETRGGNKIVVKGKKLHALWDEVPSRLIGPKTMPLILQQAKALPSTKSTVEEWPASWAGETLAAAREAFKGVTFAEQLEDHWDATLPPEYTARMNAIKKQQLANAGARLAQVLQAIWP